jgi:exopolyphosphatase/guanosine-5'-triphosphate,3'-diphosphate pyrophosphatase
LLRWTDALFPGQGIVSRALREAACWISDIGSHDHPEYRSEQAFLRVLRQHGAGLDHHARAFLALCAALRYEADAAVPFLSTARMLLDQEAIHQAETLGAALRLAYTLCGGTPALLAGTRVERRGGRLALMLNENSGVFAGESVERRLGVLAGLLGMEALVELG